MEDEYIEKDPHSGKYKRWLTHYAKVGPHYGGRIHREKSKVRHTSVGSPTSPRWVPNLKEECIEKNLRPCIHVRGLTLYAKVGPQNKGRVLYTEKNTRINCLAYTFMGPLFSHR